ncbi:major allergen Equ c 1-like isoform X1 [Dama dama]|uniref:major allergen Equ c 1-like isoform X1 n=1 Tax=Dama dama TaxID=30532 RepID=UPI002A35EB67|nr:major allergen Equ c 1-like isoform X1 [Dama dama]
MSETSNLDLGRGVSQRRSSGIRQSWVPIWVLPLACCVILITGEWYSILLASDHREKIEENGVMRIFVEYITLLENSSLFINMHTKVNGVCTELPLTCDSTGEDGVYTVRYDGKNIFRILEVNYSHHIIFYLENFSDSYKLLELYAREPDTSPELKHKFVEICQKYGVVKENVIDLTQEDRCFQARGSGVA